MNFTNLYVKNFGPDMTENEFHRLFSNYGTITRCKIETDEQGKSRLFGYVNFRTHRMAEEAIDHLNGYRLESGQRLHVSPFRKKSEQQRTTREDSEIETMNQPCLFVSDLDRNLDETILHEIFSQFGRIVYIRIMKSNGISTGNAFIKFDTRQSTLRAQTEMNGKWLRTKRICIELTESFGGEDQSDFSPRPFVTTVAAVNEPKHSYQETLPQKNPKQRSSYRYDSVLP